MVDLASTKAIMLCNALTALSTLHKEVLSAVLALFFLIKAVAVISTMLCDLKFELPPVNIFCVLKFNLLPRPRLKLLEFRETRSSYSGGIDYATISSLFTDKYGVGYCRRDRTTHDMPHIGIR